MFNKQIAELSKLTTPLESNDLKVLGVAVDDLSALIAALISISLA
jgi:hypothetical protein